MTPRFRGGNFVRCGAGHTHRSVALAEACNETRRPPAAQDLEAWERFRRDQDRARGIDNNPESEELSLPN